MLDARRRPSLGVLNSPELGGHQPPVRAEVKPVNRWQSPISTAKPNPVSVDTC